MRPLIEQRCTRLPIQKSGDIVVAIVGALAVPWGGTRAATPVRAAHARHRALYDKPLQGRPRPLPSWADRRCRRRHASTLRPQTTASWRHREDGHPAAAPRPRAIYMALLDALPASRMIAVRTNRTQQVGALQSKSHATRRDRYIWIYPLVRVFSWLRIDPSITLRSAECSC